jgi:alpha-1,2-mannosyltransferase
LWAAVSVVLVFTLVNPFQPEVGMFRGGADFHVYREAAKQVLSGGPLYTQKLFVYNWYTYPPFSAVAFLPFQLLPHGVDHHIWMAMNFVFLVAAVAQCFRLLNYSLTPRVWAFSGVLAVGFTFVEPVRSTIWLGQINLLLLLIVLWDVSLRTDSRFKGIGTGFASAIKLTPSYFIIYYGAIRQWRAAMVAAGTFAASVAVAWIVIPTDSGQYWTRAVFDSSRVNGEVGHPSNQSLRGALARLLGSSPPHWLWLIIALAVVVIGTWTAVRLYRRGEQLLAVTVTGMSSAVVSPFTWSHHWVWFVPLLVYLVDRALTHPWWWLAAAGLFVVVGSWPYQFPSEKVPRVGLYKFPPAWISGDILGNLYLVLFGIVVVCAAAWVMTPLKDSGRSSADDANAFDR